MPSSEVGPSLLAPRLAPRLTPLAVLVLLVVTLAARSAAAAPPGESAPAEVRMPLAAYQQLSEQARAPEVPAQPPPARYALGQASVELRVDEDGARLTGHVEVALSVRVLGDGWVAVPLLPSGTALSSASVDDREVELLNGGLGLALPLDSAGVHSVTLYYDVDAQSSPAGHTFAIPLPESAGSTLRATLPGSGLDAAVIPATATKLVDEDGATVISATLASSRGVQVSFRPPSPRGHTLSRARYRGTLEGDAMRFGAELSLDVRDGGTVALPLVPSDVILGAVTVDGKPGTIVVEDDSFVTHVHGRGTHRVALAFELPVVREDGPPHVALRIPEVPVSELEVVLPGDKEISLDPASHVQSVRRGGSTVSKALLPLTSAVRIRWAEAVPEAASEELLANANVFHLVHAEEGVLYVRAMVVYEVTSGRTNVLQLEVPSDVQVSDVHATDGAIKQTTKHRGEARAGLDRYAVFLDRELQGELRFDVLYERKLSGSKEGLDALNVPVIRAAGVSRQRGMVALLASKELTLAPDARDERALTRVGENQLPSFVREAVDKTIAHTYKYLEEAPVLRVRPVPPEKKQGKLDAQVDTLVSLGDVTLRGSSTIQIDVKSGAVETLALQLPVGVNLLGLTAPSLRTHAVAPPGAGAPAGAQRVELQFTQQMEGQFRVRLSYEKITSEGEGRIDVPTPHVLGAEVEQGRIAIEALSTVEVGEASRAHLSPLDPSELPQQLVLETSNPILRAYKYVQATPPHALSLAVTRHKQVEVQQAAIDEARYQTLYTRDGLAVTTARFTVRNSRAQFLKVRLPEHSRVWSALVAGRVEKPAIEEHPKQGPTVLIKIVTSTEGFPVELVYETPAEPIGSLGRVTGTLPSPDMVVTRTAWDVFLPEGVQYGEPESNMEPGVRGERVDGAAVEAALTSQPPGAAPEPLRVRVPAAGVRYAFSKIYANRSKEPARFTLAYHSAGGAWLARLLALAGVALLGLGGMAWTQGARPRVMVALSGAGAALLVLAHGVLDVGLGWSLLGALLLLAVLGGRWVVVHRPRPAAAAPAQ